MKEEKIKEKQDDECEESSKRSGKFRIRKKRQQD